MDKIYKFFPIGDINLSELEDYKSYTVNSIENIGGYWAGHFIKEEPQLLKEILLECAPVKITCITFKI